MTTTHHTRTVTGVRATLALGIGASLAANILAADPSIIGRVIAAWSPVALAVTVELLSRVPVGPGWTTGRLRVAWAGAIAGIAAWVSYWHMVEVALAYGESETAAHLLPLSVDGLVVVAAVTLAELTRTATVTAKPVKVKAPVTANVPSTTPPTHRPPGRSVGSVADNATDNVTKKATVLQLHKDNPTWDQKQLAAAAGVTDRSVRRYLAAAHTLTAVPTTSREANG